MKTIVFGDIHGRTVWKDIVKAESPDRVVFLGDYFDPYDEYLINGMHDNFNDILKLKADMDDNCILLIGNHDYHYMGFTHDYSSRYDSHTYRKVHDMLSSFYQDGTLKFAYQQDGMMMTHAGISSYWLNEVAHIDKADFTADDLNTVKPNLFAFNILTDYYDCYGDSISQSPIWIRPNALLSNSITEYSQIVGHTRFRTPTYSKEHNENGPSIYFIDTLENGGYAVIEDGQVKMKLKLKQLDNV